MRAIITHVVAALALCMAFVPRLLSQDNCSHPRIISVTGTSEIKVAPDGVNLALGVESHDKELVLAKANNDKRVKRLMALTQEAGVDAKNIQTSALTMGPEYSEDKIPKFLGYEVSQTIVMTLKDISKYEALMTSFLQAGVNRVNGIRFVVAESRKYRDEARLKAIRAAREKALAMAAELGQTTGKPWEVAEGTDYDAGYLAVNSFTRNDGAQLPQEQSTIAGGEVTIRASVRINFQLE
jgi:uncharacterized protein